MRSLAEVTTQAAVHSSLCHEPGGLLHLKVSNEIKRHLRASSCEARESEHGNYEDYLRNGSMSSTPQRWMMRRRVFACGERPYTASLLAWRRPDASQCVALVATPLYAWFAPQRKATSQA